MICRLGHLPAAYSSLGAKGKQLQMLHDNGVAIADTIVLTADAFHDFTLGDSVGEKHMADLISQLGESNLPHDQPIMLRATSDQEYLGLETDVVSDRSYTGLKASIERIYRSWSDDRARAARIVRRIPEELSIPVVLLQPNHRTVRVWSRDAKTGDPNEAVDDAARLGVQIVLLTSLLRRIERVLRMPSEIRIATDGTLRVDWVAEQFVSDAGYWRWLHEYYEQGLLDDADYIIKIKPEMISEVTGYRLSGKDVCTFHAWGVSRGVACGKMLLYDDGLDRTNIKDSILVIKDWSTDIVEALAECAGAINLNQWGPSRTSHFAMACRAQGTPAVARKGDIHQASKSVVFDDGRCVREPAIVMIDGSSGMISTASSETATTVHRLRHGALQSVETIVATLRRYEDIELFRRLPTDAQEHVGILRARLRKAGVAL